MKRTLDCSPQFCPMCGNQLILIDRDVPMSLYENYENIPDDNDSSYWVKCSSCHCFGDDFPLVIHHPLGDLKSAPGDSWSLSWVK